MAHKADGRRVVAAAVTGITAMIGVSVIWLPFMSDRDKLRGMAEDENMTEEERFQMMRQMSMELSKERAQSTNEDKSFLSQSGLQGEHSTKSSGSMWKNMTQAKSR